MDSEKLINLFLKKILGLIIIYETKIFFNLLVTFRHFYCAKNIYFFLHI